MQSSYSFKKRFGWDDSSSTLWHVLLYTRTYTQYIYVIIHTMSGDVRHNKIRIAIYHDFKHAVSLNRRAANVNNQSSTKSYYRYKEIKLHQQYTQVTSHYI